MICGVLGSIVEAKGGVMEGWVGSWREGGGGGGVLAMPGAYGKIPLPQERIDPQWARGCSGDYNTTKAY